MKAKIIPIFLSIGVLCLFLSSCQDSTYKEYKGYAPVYMSYDELRSSVKAGQVADIKNPGKIYFKDNYIFIVDELTGIHVFDNTDPSAPVKKNFITVPGVVDIAISGNIMYADSYVDLVMLDLQDINAIKETGRMKDIIAYTVPSHSNDYPTANVDIARGVVVSWDLRTIKEKINYDPVIYPEYIYATADVVSSGNKTTGGVSGSGIGVGGSMARFAIKDNTLYLLGSNRLTILDISTKSSPRKSNEIYPGSQLETIFLTGKNMFLGSTTGMVIYDISNPVNPSSRTSFTHARSCDPVIVDDTLAYITLRTGTNCGGTLNCLDVVNVKDLTHPVAVASYSMTNPHGLAKSSNLLFVCDGSAGLKIYDASKPKQITNYLVKSYPGINTYDVIPIGNMLFMVGDGGLYQYDFSDPGNIILKSRIAVATR